MSTTALHAVTGEAVAAPRPARAGALGSLWRMALADVLERTRRPGYFVSLLVMAWLTNGMLPSTGAGYRTFSMGDQFRPAYGPEWTGALVGSLCGLYFLLVGFYQVKGAVERDRVTGVGQILAAARVSRRRYLAAKALSNFVVLASMLLVALGVALVTQQLLHEDPRFDPLATASTLFALGLPAAALTSASAVLIECIPGLAGSAGNVVWFVASMALLGSGIVSSERGAGVQPHDLMGLGAISQSTYEALHAAHPEANVSVKEYSMGVNVSPRWKSIPVVTFPWHGFRWTPRALLFRIEWLGWAALIVALAALVFDRFERPARVRDARGSALAPWLERLRGAGPAVAFAPGAVRASALPPAPRGFDFATLVRAELALMLHGTSVWWFLALAGLSIACLLAPLSAVRQGLLPVIAIGPLLMVSTLGSRERRDGVEALLFSVARPVGRMLAAQWCAGTFVLIAVGAVGALRLAFAGEWAAVAGWLLGGATLGSLAVALGVWTGGSKLFEVLVLFAWYVGPMHHIAELDFTGVTTPRSAVLWAAYAAIAAGSLAAAWAGRVRQVRR